MPPATPSRTASRAAPGTLAFLAWLAAVQPGAVPALVLAGAAWTAALPSQGYAQSRSRPSSSGGYSRPSTGGSSFSRTPSFSASPRPSLPRTPSFSGGYGLPSREPRSPAAALPFGSQSAGDRAFSRERSREALGRFDTRREPAIPVQPAPQYSQPQRREPSEPNPWFDDRPSFSAPRRYAQPVQPAPDPRAQWYGQQGWSAPILPAPLPAYGAGRSFGVWDGLFLWSLLSNLGRPGAADFFHNHRDDEGYQAWRSEADRLAQENAEVRRRLAELDDQLAQREGQPKDPNYLPPGVPPGVAEAPWTEEAPAEPDKVRTPSVAAATDAGGGSGYVWPVVLGGAGLLGFLAWRRRRTPASAGAGAAATGAGGMSSMRGGTNTPLQAAGAMLRHKLSGEGYAPQRFRVGMTIQLDPTPFVLAGDAIKLPQPQGTGQVGVKEVGRADAPGGTLVRLYLPDDRSMVQLLVSQASEPVECRLFGTIDEVAPADEAEWGVWLDAAEGLIGWPEFQTKDGKIYARAWSPGERRVEPRVISETVEALDGTRTVQSRAMLYSAPTGVPAPAPQTEYVLVAAVDDGRQAWVEIRSGIDLNPATLQLA